MKELCYTERGIFELIRTVPDQDLNKTGKHFSVRFKQQAGFSPQDDDSARIGKTHCPVLHPGCFVLVHGIGRDGLESANPGIVFADTVFLVMSTEE